MTEQIWLMLLSGLGAANLTFVTMLIRMVISWRKELKAEMDKYCAQNVLEHKDIWHRINHHKHTDYGDVTITD